MPVLGHIAEKMPGSGSLSTKRLWTEFLLLVIETAVYWFTIRRSTLEAADRRASHIITSSPYRTSARSSVATIRMMRRRSDDSGVLHISAEDLGAVRWQIAFVSAVQSADFQRLFKSKN